MDQYTEPDYSNIGLITIDTQNDFSLKGAVYEVKGTYEVIPNMAKILNKFREKNKLIMHVVRIYKEDGSNVDICRKKKVEEGLKVAAPNSIGSELVKELKPNTIRLDTEKLLKGEIQKIAQNEFVIYKSRWGAFYKTPLEAFLKEKGVTTLVFTGCNFPNCPRTSIYEASERDFKLVVIEDAISGIYSKGIEELKNICCELVGTEEFLKKFSYKSLI
jgi:nicotinamidase-related amidase